MKLYKLTDQNLQTYKGTQWKNGERKTASGTGDLCSSGWLHAYEHPLLAVLLNPIHANFDDPRLFEAEGKIGKRDGQLKVGCTELTLTKEIPLPIITTEQRVKFAIACALTVDQSPEFRAWASKWLTGKDRSEEAAKAAWAAREAAWAARAARETARAAAWAAREAAAAAAAAEAAEAARAAAAAAAWATEAAAQETKTRTPIKLAQLAEQAILPG